MKRYPFHNLCGEDSRMRCNPNETPDKRINYVQEQAWAQQLAFSVMLAQFSFDLPENMRDRFNRLVYDVRKNAEQQTMNDERIRIMSKFPITNEPMRTIEELKNEIYELKNARINMDVDIEVLNSKNKNAQAQRDRVTAKIDGLKWMLNEEES